jgi:hypothetical protein
MTDDKIPPTDELAAAEYLGIIQVSALRILYWSNKLAKELD